MELSNFISLYQSEIHRIVESQEKVATMRIVDTLDEQAYLEELIEESKPTVPQKSLRHYLIQTPFRYPPLKHGSRFGTRYEPSIFYAGQTLHSALCESAFYSFYFMSRSVTPFEDTIINHKTSFSVQVDSSTHADLTLVRDQGIQEKLTHKTNYEYTQKIGKQMRTENIKSFSFCSARCDDMINVGVFDIDTIEGDPFKYNQWEIKQTPNEILFYCASNSAMSSAFNIEQFLNNGILPHPSN